MGAIAESAKDGGSIESLRKHGYRVHPEQAMRQLNKAWDAVKCGCLDSSSQFCSDGEVVNAETGEPENLSAEGKACRNEKYVEVINDLGDHIFSVKGDKTATVYATGATTEE